MVNDGPFLCISGMCVRSSPLQNCATAAKELEDNLVLRLSQQVIVVSNTKDDNDKV